ncbi:serine threonine- kinase 19 isoform X1 [Chlorella sorokiniana]|uniref:Serine threonine-kinase 19 isoform X1 n=1 Tax=Chlorella sorokiniana TaxID=3076 RepID=A0A2P6THJ0_CHLSO|nr:serine threonine- kinase 19 isoform X1 [Chlorella sorokiniana]|eukprot:PRW33736.1 serine threonine- kinase 19 isoform X1 [Chlorella sorokiniana]
MSKTLRLPPPPAKRQRLAGGVGAPAGGAPAAAAAAAAAAGPAPPRPRAALHNSGLHDTYAFDELAVEADVDLVLPNDTLAALHLLRGRFPAEAKVAPFATKAQLYTVLADRTAVDRQLDELRRSNAVRVMQLPAGKDEYAIMLTQDYVAALRRSKAAVLHPPASGGSQDEEAGSSAAAAAAGGRPTAAAQQAAQVFDWMESRVLPACSAAMVTHAELLQLLAGSGGGGRSGASSAAAAPRAAATGAAGAAAAGQSAVTDAHVSLLLNHGFLTRYTGGPDGYLFSMPNAGAAVRSVAAGRAEIQSWLQRRRPHELLESELEKRKMQRSVLGVRWHVADMVGSGALLRRDTAVGPLLIAGRRGG